MDYARHTDDAELVPGPGGAHALARLFDAGSGCLVFDQRVIRIPAAKVKVLSAQPVSSYSLTTAGKETELRILDATAFRSVKRVVILKQP